MIEVDSLTKRFGAINAVDRVTFSVADGEILGFLGPNGAGKTTTLRILTGYMPASEGTARVAGFDVARDSMEVRRRVGYLPESVPVYREQSVRDYLSFVADLKGLPRNGKTRALDDVMDRCGLAEVRNRLVGRLSRGYRQRVGLAQALVNDPPLLVMDEPTVGLDPGQVVEVRQLIKSLAGRRTVLLSTHILPEVSQICSRVLIINRGRIAASGTPAELTSRLTAGQRFQVRVRGDGVAAAALLRSLAGLKSAQVETADAGGATLLVEAEPDLDLRGDMVRALVAGGSELLEFKSLPMSLEEIFLALVREEPEGESGAGAGGGAPAGGAPPTTGGGAVGR